MNTPPGNEDAAGAGGRVKDAAAVARRADEAGLRLVRFLWCGNDGTVRAKATALAGLEGRIETGIGVTFAMQAMNGLDQMQPVEGMGPVGEVRLVPDLETFRVLPYAPQRPARCWSTTSLSTATPAPVCQRSFLKRRRRGWPPAAPSCEAASRTSSRSPMRGEDGYLPVDECALLLDDRRDRVAGLRRRAADALDEQEIELEQYYAELGHGQLEISTAHRPALRAADEQILVRETIRGVAAGAGCVASLAPKPWPDSGRERLPHPLLALERRRAATASTSPGGPTSSPARRAAFIAGVLAHLPGLCGLTAPSFNSYPRIVPRFWAGAFACWGHDNREAPVRVPSAFRGIEEASTNVELKSADASCNPYLALGGLIAAGLDGLERGLEPPEPVEVDPATLDDAERRARGIEPMPASQEEALDALAGDRGADRGARTRRSPSPTSRSAARSGPPTPRGTATFEQRGPLPQVLTR